VLYNLFNWPMLQHSRLVVVGIANTMDLPERLLPRVSSRMGMKRIVFEPYTRVQIEAIVKSRLRHHTAVFQADAVEMVARKVLPSPHHTPRTLCHTHHRPPPTTPADKLFFVSTIWLRGVRSDAYGISSAYLHETFPL
jgi:hypothetical protein